MGGGGGGMLHLGGGVCGFSGFVFVSGFFMWCWVFFFFWVCACSPLCVFCFLGWGFGRGLGFKVLGVGGPSPEGPTRAARPWRVLVLLEGSGS